MGKRRKPLVALGAKRRGLPQGKRLERPSDIKRGPPHQPNRATENDEVALDIELVVDDGRVGGGRGRVACEDCGSTAKEPGPPQGPKSPTRPRVSHRRCQTRRRRSIVVKTADIVESTICAHVEMWGSSWIGRGRWSPPRSFNADVTDVEPSISCCLTGGAGERMHHASPARLLGRTVARWSGGLEAREPTLSMRTRNSGLMLAEDPAGCRAGDTGVRLDPGGGAWRAASLCTTANGSCSSTRRTPPAHDVGPSSARSVELMIGQSRLEPGVEQGGTKSWRPSRCADADAEAPVTDVSGDLARPAVRHPDMSWPPQRREDFRDTRALAPAGPVCERKNLTGRSPDHDELTPNVQTPPTDPRTRQHRGARTSERSLPASAAGLRRTAYSGAGPLCWSPG